MLKLKFFMSNMLFMTRWKTFMSCGSVKGLEEYLRLDGYRLKMMGDELKESWTSKNGQRILKSQKGVAKLSFWLVASVFIMKI